MYLPCPCIQTPIPSVAPLPVFSVWRSNLNRKIPIKHDVHYIYTNYQHHPLTQHLQCCPTDICFTFCTVYAFNLQILKLMKIKWQKKNQSYRILFSLSSNYKSIIFSQLCCFITFSFSSSWWLGHPRLPRVLVAWLKRNLTSS